MEQVVAGPVGPQGPIGLTGPAGADGADGAVGPQGPQGPAGADGADGAAGPQGPIGPTGLQGPQGEPGPRGQRGPRGNPGPDVLADLTILTGLSWPPEEVMDPNSAVGVLSPLRFEWSADLDPTLVEGLGVPIVRVDLLPIRDTERPFTVPGCTEAWPGTVRSVDLARF